ncbi:MAG: DUF2953 domain-containing protein [Eubacteriales bacterium]
MVAIIWIVITVVSFYIGMRRVFVFIKIEKYKKHYFFYIGLGACCKCRVIRLCIVMKQNRDGTRRIMLVKRKGKTSMIMDLSKTARVDPDLTKILWPAVYAEKLDFELKIGLEDAKDSCLLCGFLLAAIHALMPIVRSHIRLEKTNIRITPLFKKEKTTARLDCILKIDLVHIIFRYFKIKKLKKEKAVLENASN